MKILIVTNYPGSFPYVDELGYWLDRQGVKTDVLDLSNLVFYHWQEGKYRQKTLVLPEGLQRRLCLLPKIGRFLRKGPLKKWLQKLALQEEYDIVNLHYADPYYVDYMPELKALGKRFVPVIWGSDFYRVDAAGRERQRTIYDASDAIIFGNPGVAKAFTEHYNTYGQKSRIAGFGIAKLELLKELIARTTKEGIRRDLGIPEGRICVTCGYNGHEQQQHEWMLEAISGVPEDVKASIHLILPMTYAASRTRIEAIRQMLQKMGVTYTLFEKFMTDEEAGQLRIISDIVVNAQTSDSLSASLQEHMYAGNILIAGDWLPYGLFEDLGVKLYRFSKANFGTFFSDLVRNFETKKQEVSGNPEKIYALSAWKHRINQWMSIFESSLQA